MKGGLIDETHFVEWNGHIWSGAAAVLAALAALLGTRRLPMSCSSGMVRLTKMFAHAALGVWCLPLCRR